MIPSLLEHEILEVIRAQAGQGASILASHGVGGGCIHHGMKLETTAGDFFLKYNDKRELPNFEAESKGLTLLRSNGNFRVPVVLHLGSNGKYAWLLMEFIERGGKDPRFFTVTGENLAAMHRHVSPAFGLDHPNFIGRLPQSNAFHEDWHSFFIHERLAPQLSLAAASGLVDRKFTSQFEQLYSRVPELIPASPPSLLHGDLWSGNLMCDSGQRPVLIDPAVYYGHREAEIAFTMLFGGFAPEFYDAYNAVWPLEKGWRNRVGLFNLYPLMVHLNLFGHSYLPEIQTVLNKFS